MCQGPSTAWRNHALMKPMPTIKRNGTGAQRAIGNRPGKSKAISRIELLRSAARLKIVFMFTHLGCRGWPSRPSSRMIVRSEPAHASASHVLILETARRVQKFQREAATVGALPSILARERLRFRPWRRKTAAGA